MSRYLNKAQLILSFSFVAFSFLSHAQNWQWAKRAGSSGDNAPFTGGNEMINDLKVDKAGNIYAVANIYANPSFYDGQIFGETTPNGYGEDDGYLIKYSPCGTTLWRRRMGGTSNDAATSLVIDNNGNVFVTGYCLGTGNFGDGVHDTLTGGGGTQFIAKFDTAGTFKEVKNYPYGLGKILLNSQGDFIITDGLTAAKINTFGIVINTYSFITTTPYYPDVRGISMDKNDNIYIAGSFDNTVNIGPGTILLPTASTLVAGTNAANSLIMKFSPTGNMTWYQRGNSDVGDAQWGCSIDTSGAILAVGGEAWNGSTVLSYYINGGTGSSANTFFMLDASNGNMLSAKTGTRDYQSRIVPTYTDRDNNFICAGFINGFLAFNTTSYSAVGNSGNQQNCIGKFDAAGNFDYISLLPQVGSGNGKERITNVVVNEQGNILIGGMFGGTLDSAGTAVNVIGGQEDGFVANYGFACNSSSTSLSPLPPTNLTATPINTAIANYVHWIDNSHYETGYELWAIGGNIPSYSLIATLAANTTTYNHTALQISTNYCYKARAIDNVGPSVFTNIGCAMTGTATSMRQQTALADFNLYPNPTSGEVTLQFVSTGTKVDVTVINNIGQIVSALSLQGNIGDNSHLLRLPQTKGIYSVRVSTSTATLIRKVMVE